MAKEGVSFVIPNWNHEVMLPRAIGSAMRAIEILRQEGRPGEAIVVDHASRDGSRTLLRQLEALYYEDGFRCLAFDLNEGQGVGRNQGVEHARYRHVVFLDADNELIPENLPIFVRALEETGAAACYGNLLIRTVTGDHAHFLLSNESFQKRLFQGCCYLDTFAVWDRLQYLDVGGYAASLRAAEDYDLWLHLAAIGRKIVFVPAALGYYYLLPASRSSDHRRVQDASGQVLHAFNQGKLRDFLPLNTNELMYYPGLSYI
jgi:glycosyltransferase involved in cell wall biosynthesis